MKREKARGIRLFLVLALLLPFASIRAQSGPKTTTSLLSKSVADDDGETLTDANGKRYRRVKVTEVDAIGITVMHAGGVTRIPFGELPVEVQRRYGYDPAKAAKLAEAEAAAESASAAAAERQRKAAEFERVPADEIKKALAREYLALVREIFSSHNYISLVVRDDELVAEHDFFSQYTLSLGDAPKQLSAWIGKRRDLLRRAGVKALRLEGTGQFASSCSLKIP